MERVYHFAAERPDVLRGMCCNFQKAAGGRALAVPQTLTCAVRLTPAGLRLEQWIGTQRLVSQTLQTEDELYEQAEVVRQQCLDEGWVEES